MSNREWWDDYIFAGKNKTYLKRFKNVGEFQDTIPYDLKLGINKITIAEAIYWSMINDESGNWPTVAECLEIRSGRKYFTES